MANPLYILWKILLLADTCNIYIGNYVYTKLTYINKAEWMKSNTDTWERESVDEKNIKQILNLSNILNRLKVDARIDSLKIDPLIYFKDFWNIFRIELHKNNYKEQYDIKICDIERVLTKLSEYRYPWSNNNAILHLETDINQINFYKEKERKKLMQKSCINAAILAKQFHLPYEIRDSISQRSYLKN